MEQNEKDLIAKKVESKQYFNEGLNWYNSRFIRPQTQFAQMFVCAVIAIIIFATSLAGFLKVFPLSKGSAIIFSAETNSDQRLDVINLASRKENPTESYIKFMLKEFVRSYEEYREVKIDRNQQFIIHNSTEAVSVEYLIANDRSNADAPIVKYGKQASRIIYIPSNSMSFLKRVKETMQPGEKEGSAQVRFASTLLFNDSERTNNYEADIKFTYTELIVDQQTNEIKQLPKIIITDYKTKSI